MRKRSLISLIVAVIVIFSAIYLYRSSGRITGTSNDDMWKAAYIENRDAIEPTGWVASLKQKNKEEVEVKKLRFLEDDKVLAEHSKFHQGRSEDGIEYSRHPFSYPDFYLGDSPNKSHEYKVQITYQKEGRDYEDTIVLD